MKLEDNKDTERQNTIPKVISVLVRFTPFLIGIPILFVLNYMCYEINDRLLKPVTNLIWIALMIIYWFKYYK